jgi:hypothetical protein
MDIVTVSILPKSQLTEEEEQKWLHKQRQFFSRNKKEWADYLEYSNFKRDYFVAQEKVARAKMMPNSAVAAVCKDYFENAQALLEFGWQFYYLAKFRLESLVDSGNGDPEITAEISRFNNYKLKPYKEEMIKLQHGIRAFFK